MSYRQIFYQIVFGTQNRETTIAEEHCERIIQVYLGIIKNKITKAISH